MINFSKVIRAAGYTTRHLSHNDYYEEGLKVEGYWFGKGAALLGLSGVKSQQAWEAICANRHPATGKRLTARSPKIEAFDFVVSAPKAVSVLAMVGGDHQLLKDHQEAAQLAMRELERFAARRLRQGAHFDSEELIRCGNIIALRYNHTAARGVEGQIDPQVHTHFLIANRTWDAVADKWYALSEKEMASELSYAREVYRNELARRLKGHGYGIENRKEGFGITGLDEAIEQKFSRRSIQRDEAIAKFKAEHGREPTKREIAKLVKASRAKKMPHCSAAEVLRQQRERLTPEELKQIRAVVAHGILHLQPEPISHTKALAFSVADLLERNSLIKETELLRNALEHARGDLDLAALKIELERGISQQRLFRIGDWITTQEMLQAEENICSWVRWGKAMHVPLGGDISLPDHFTAEQKAVVRGVLASKDHIIALIGDAGTSKTTCAEYITQGIYATGREVLGLAPTGSAVVELRKVVPRCDTLQGFLANPKKQEEAARKTLLVDEAGMIDMRSMERLAALSQKWKIRVVLIGDPKQNRSVGAGDAFRCLLEEGILETHHLTEIWRQTDPAFKSAVQLLAQGKGAEAFDAFESLGVVAHVPEEEKLHAAAAQAYVEAIQSGKTVLAVSPVWSEIDAFHSQLRPRLKEAGLLGREDAFSVLEAGKTFTTARKRDFRRFEVDHVLRFHRKTEQMKPGEEVRIVEKKRLGLVVEKADGKRFSLRVEDAEKFTVYREKKLLIASGEKLLIRGNCKEANVSTGDVVEVAAIHPDRSLLLKGGQTLPTDFRFFDYGYCLTSQGSQGKKAQVSISIMGEKGLRSAKAREAYVAHSRFQEKIAVFTVDKEKAREVFQKASQRLLVKEARLVEERKNLSMARAQVRNAFTSTQKETEYGPQRTRRNDAATPGYTPGRNPAEIRLSQPLALRQSEPVADGGELRHRPGPDRPHHPHAGKSTRVRSLRRSELERQRARRAVAHQPREGYRL